MGDFSDRLDTLFTYLYHKSLKKEDYPKALKKWFKKKTGEDLNLDAPRNFSEKIQWMKLYDSTQEKADLSDKYLVRDWVKERIGEKYLVPLYGVWDRAEKVDGFEYKMSDNDLYVYTVAHLREHYVSAEACFRPVMDIFLLNKKYGDRLDFDYINTELSKLGLLKFAENIKRLGECMFDGAETDDTMTLMENYVVFGPPVKNAALAAKADKSKPARILSSAFPGLSHMRKLFPVLEKYPFLIVVFWFVRIFKNIFKKETREKLDAIQETGEKEYNVLHDIYRKSGIE